MSSTCFGMDDLRATIETFLTNRKITAFLSNDKGFPHHHGLKPHVSCLKTIDECQFVIGVLDRKYGKEFDDWNPYTELNSRGLSPTHGELLHTLKTKKRLFLYVRDEIMVIYYSWVRNKSSFNEKTLRGIDPRVLEVIEEFQNSEYKPWIREFKNVQDIISSLEANLVNDLYSFFKEREKENEDQARYILDKLLEFTPEIRQQVEAEISKPVLDELEKAKQDLQEVDERSKKEKGALEREKEALSTRISLLSSEVTKQKLTLVRAAVKDASWLTYVRTHLMPKQPGRVPFHNDAEVGMRGFHVSNLRSRSPKLTEVTWSKLARKEGGAGSRGFDAGIIFKGSDFAPGVLFTHRRAGETSPPTGNKDYFWNQPNIYFSDYLEVSCGLDEDESPLSWNDYEFCLKNPEGKQSNWVKFTYNFDFEKLNKILDENEKIGKELLNQNKFYEAIEPLRKAYVFSDRLNGISDKRTKELKALHNKAIDDNALSKMRFREGDKVIVAKGEHLGKMVVIEKLGLRATKCYWVKIDGQNVALADDEVDKIEK